ncbi:hypothetical protein N7517_006092 [Penicillium concentricum]|uniref:BTB domain-containing protein n=1 Tax=Penicillium concentricum TaxID=293559 RepID=A0A9W9S8N4_9EURO|nr:uncharacterized protein N7517_006092 [Penicillium concentricum]KAJ5374086.1 hypothetical protein N7517_006092 [Penicillium concentricum]
MAETSEQSVASFATSRLPLFHGPLVKIQVQPIGCGYTVSKALLCTESRVFSAMFAGGFLEAKQETVKLEEMNGVISPRSLEALFQWLYLRFIKFDLDYDSPEEHISAAVELARLADKYEITGIESQIAQYIKETIIANPQLEDDIDGSFVNNNIFWLDDQDIISGILLHDGHPVRQILAAASVAGYLQTENHKFAELAQRYPKVAADLLHEVRLTLNGLEPHGNACFKDPIGVQRLCLY